jgi:hypothetical protein
MLATNDPLAKGVARPAIWQAANRMASQGFIVLPIFVADYDPCKDMLLADYALSVAQHYTLSRLQDGSAQAFVRLDAAHIRAQAVVAARG